MFVEDAAVDPDTGAIQGVVVNWAPVNRQQMHVDPLVFTARAVVDATGHPAYIVQTVFSKNPQLSHLHPQGVPGERSLAAQEGERLTVVHTGKVAHQAFMCAVWLPMG